MIIGIVKSATENFDEFDKIIGSSRFIGKDGILKII